MLQYSTASKWVTRTGFPFTVPNQCDELTFNQILRDIYPHLGDDDAGTAVTDAPPISP